MPGTTITARMFRFARKELGLSVRAIAKKIHISKSSITRIENEETYPHRKTINRLLRLCQENPALGIATLADLVRLSRHQDLSCTFCHSKRRAEKKRNRIYTPSPVSRSSGSSTVPTRKAKRARPD